MIFAFRKKVGVWGENVAVEYLKSKGYKIVERNFRCRFGEIDIIAEDGDVLTFVEVRTRFEGEKNPPQLSVNNKKQNHISRVAKYYIMLKKIKDVVCRFDVVAINKKDMKIEHIINAFEVEGYI